MSDNSLLNMYATQAELDQLKKDIEEIRKQNTELINSRNNSMENVDDFQMEVSRSLKEIRETINALSIKVSNYDGRFSEMSENLEQLNQKLDKHDKILTQNNEASTKQDQATQGLKMRENNLGEQTILLLGGNDEEYSDSLLMLENNGQNWKELNIKLPCGISGFGAQCLNNSLYIFGGWNSDSTYKLSESLQWEKMADMNEEHQEISNSSVILNNQIWVCGGWNRYNLLKSLEMYDPLTNEWKEMKDMNEERYSAAAAVVNGKIFCSGGSGWRDLLNSVECYDPSSDVWTLIYNMPQSVRGQGAVEMNGHFIVMGGCANGEYLNNVWALDTTNENAVWIEKPSMSIPRSLFSIAKIHDKLFVCGGATKEDVEWKYHDSVEIFDEEVWRNGPKMPTRRDTAPAVVIPISFAKSLK